MKFKSFILPVAVIIALAASMPALAVREVIKASVTPSITEAKVDDTFTVTLSFTAAAWNIHLAATGPVSGCTIDEADTTSDAQAAPQSFTTNCTATGTGTIVLTLSGDVSVEQSGVIYTDTQSGSTTIVVIAETTGNDPTGGDDPTDGDTPTGGDTGGTTTGNGNVSLPKTYDSVGRSFAAVSALGAILIGVYLYNRNHRG